MINRVMKKRKYDLLTWKSQIKMDRDKSKCKFLADRRRIQLDSSFLFVPQTLGELCFPESPVDISFQICLLVLQSIFFCSNLFSNRSNAFSMNFNVAASAINVH